MEDLLYILLFVFIVGVNLLIKNKNVLEKAFDTSFENEEKYKENLSQKVQNEQKLYRQRNEKHSDSAVLQNSSEILTYNKNFENQKPQKPQNTAQSSLIFLNGKILKEAVILKEILDLPVGLR